MVQSVKKHLKQLQEQRVGFSDPLVGFRYKFPFAPEHQSLGENKRWRENPEHKNMNQYNNCNNVPHLQKLNNYQNNESAVHLFEANPFPFLPPPPKKTQSPTCPY